MMEKDMLSQLEHQRISQSEPQEENVTTHTGVHEEEPANVGSERRWKRQYVTPR